VRNVEYVSANPTGPLHVGHCRGAVFGDALANLLAFSGFKVTLRARGGGGPKAKPFGDTVNSLSIKTSLCNRLQL
jgi:hypothetical protein